MLMSWGWVLTIHAGYLFLFFEFAGAPFFSRVNDNLTQPNLTKTYITVLY
jgi:hypothetical protein